MKYSAGKLASFSKMNRNITQFLICVCLTSLQVYFYSFDVFRAAGIPEEKLRYTALGTGLCEFSTVVSCVSTLSLISNHVCIQ